MAPAKNAALHRESALPPQNPSPVGAPERLVDDADHRRCPQSLCDIARVLGVVRDNKDTYLRSVLASHRQIDVGRVATVARALGQLVPNMGVVEGPNL